MPRRPAAYPAAYREQIICPSRVMKKWRMDVVFASR
jgi:hypothetical protein